MIKYSFVLISILLLGIMTQPVSGDWIDYMSWRLDSDDILGVCLYEPDEHNIKNSEDYILGATILALEEWNNRLKTYTNDDNFSIEVYYISLEEHMDKHMRDFKYCNVHILFTEDRVDSEVVSDTTLGVTWNEGSIMGTDMSVIEIYPKIIKKFTIVEKGSNYTSDEIDQLSITSEAWIPPSGIYSIVLHEFGHAIGLGHLCQEPYGHRFDSVMIPQFDPFTDVLEISEYDLAAVYHSYGKDGWKGDDVWKPFKYGNASPMFIGSVRCT